MRRKWVMSVRDGDETVAVIFLIVAPTPGEPLTVWKVQLARWKQGRGASPPADNG